MQRIKGGLFTLQGANGWAKRGRLANRGLHVLRELLLLLPDWDPLLPEIGQFLEALHQASSATVTMLVPGGLPASNAPPTPGTFPRTSRPQMTSEIGHSLT